MTPHAVPLLLEAALRALAAAMVLWSAMRLLRVENVLAQKTAWGVVLAAALAMPLLMRAPLLPSWAAIRVPAPLWHTPAKAMPAQAAMHTTINTAGLAAIHANAAPAVGQSRSAQLRVEAQTETAADETYSALALDNSPYDAEPRNTTVAPIAAVPAMHASVPAAASTRSRFIAYGWLGYLCVAAALLVRLLMGLCSSLRLWMQAEPVEIGPDLNLPADMRGNLPRDLSRAIAVRASRRILSPVNIGSGIVLPADYTSWDAEKLRVVLAHERSHVRQRDFYLQLVAGLYAAVTWFSPLGWWLKRRLSELGEAISDRAGMEAATSPTAYAQMLLEFAALPRPAYTTGVAMAQSSNLSERIERLLNDSSFRRAFTGGRRALLVLVPAVLFATAALVHVQAAQISPQASAQASTRAGAVLVAAATAQPAVQAQDSASNSAASQSASSGQSHPDNAQVNGDAAAAPQAPPAPQAAPAPQPAPAPSEDAEPAPAAVPPVPPVPSVDVVIPAPAMPAIHVEVPVPPAHLDDVYHHYAYIYSDGDPYVIVGDPGSKTRFAGDWDGGRQADVDKARAMAHGHFLLFRHDGKTYMVDDPAIVAQIEAMQKPMEDLGEQMRAVGKQMRDEGEQAREAGRKVREQMANIPTPDLTKEMADLNAAVAELKDKQGGTITREQLTEIQRRLGEVQRRLMTAQIKVDVNLDMSQFREVQGKYGQQMGELGRQMGQAARENDQKIESIIDESMKNGKAKPVN